MCQARTDPTAVPSCISHVAYVEKAEIGWAVTGCISMLTFLGAGVGSRPSHMSAS